ncbi:MAG TPA: hypothetical protein VM240_09085 [Verrucomicrobiae bacterium]|nr:hypothetical protein [Verrucomicrobiae bacterium]
MARFEPKGLLLASALLLASCGTPESECKDGIADMKKRTSTFVGFEQTPEVRRALEGIDVAETQLATGNVAGCNTSLAEARGHLRASQRTNQ